MATIMPTGYKAGGFPTNPHFTRLVSEGHTSVKDLRTGKMTCIILRPDGRHCGEHMILQGGSGWSSPDKVMYGDTTFVDGKNASFGEATWRCPKKHSTVPEPTIGANPRVMSVEERLALDSVAKRVLDPEKGGVLGEASAEVEKETIVETKVTKTGISFDVSLDELTNADLVNQLLEKISSALDLVPTSNMGEAKKLMKIQEVVEALKK